MPAEGGRVIVVGAGAVGALHALWAVESGLEVLHLEQDLEPQGASARGFGLLWGGGLAISGVGSERPERGGRGPEAATVQRGRSLWEELAGRLKGVELRQDGSLTVALDETELHILKALCTGDKGQEVGMELLDGREAREVNRELSPHVVGAALCSSDAVIEPRLATGAIRHQISELPSYRWLSGRCVVRLGEEGGPAVQDDHGDWHSADRVFLCTGAGQRRCAAPAPEAESGRWAHWHMLETNTYPGRLETALMDGAPAVLGSTMGERLTPGTDVGPGGGAPALNGMTIVQRLDGSLTMGGWSEQEEPLPFDLDEEIYDQLIDRAEQVLRHPVPGARRRWGAVSSLPGTTLGNQFRQEVAPGVEVVRAVGLSGMTCAPALAEESIARLR